MKQTSTYLKDNTLFPLERTSIDSLDINLENQAHNSTEQQTALAEIDALIANWRNTFTTKSRSNRH